jgi:hypothetical protein
VNPVVKAAAAISSGRPIRPTGDLPWNGCGKAPGNVPAAEPIGENGPGTRITVVRFSRRLGGVPRRSQSVHRSPPLPLRYQGVLNAVNPNYLQQLAPAMVIRNKRVVCMAQRV